MTLYISCYEGFLQSFMKETHMHYPKHESELALPCLSSPLPFKGLATTTLFCHSVITKPTCDGQVPAVLASLTESLPFGRCPSAPAYPPPITVSLCMELQ